MIKFSRWCEHFLTLDTGKKIKFAPHQREILDYAISFDEDGRLQIKELTYSCPKKSGKTTIGGCIMAYYLFNVEAPNECYACANSRDQASARAFRDLKNFIKRNKHLRGEVLSQRDDRIELKSGSVAMAIPSDSSTQAGANPGLVLFDELWAYTSERDERFYEEMTLPPTRKAPLRVVTSYAGHPGESRILEKIYQRFLDADGNPQPGVEMPLPGLPVYVKDGACCYWDTEGRMSWQDEAYYQEQMRTLRPSTFARLHRNMWCSSDEKLLSLEDINAAIIPGHGPCFEANPGYNYYGGLDLGLKRDRCAFAIIHRQDGRILLDHLRLFQPPRHGEVDLAEVEAHVSSVAKAFRLQKLLMDPWNSAHLRQALGRQNVRVEEFFFSSQSWGKLAMGLLSAFKDRIISIYRDEELIKELSTCRIIETTNGCKLSNPSGQHDDLTTALALAVYGCRGQAESTCGIFTAPSVTGELLYQKDFGISPPPEPDYNVKSLRQRAEEKAGKTSSGVWSNEGHSFGGMPDDGVW